MPLLIEPGWQKRGKCNGLSQSESDRLFFVDRGGKTGPADKFCNGCPVRSSCLNYAILYNECGFWAGTSENERAFASAELKEALRKEAIKFGRLENRDIESLIRFGRRRDEFDVIETVEEWDLLEFPEQVFNGSQSVSQRVDNLIGSVSNLFRELGFTVA